MSTTLQDKILRKLNEDWEWYNQKETTKEAQVFHESLKETLGLLKDVRKTKDPAYILEIEKSILEHSLNNNANSAEMKSSLKTGLAELEAGLEFLQIVQNSDQYQAIKRGSVPKDIQGGLPLDGFRKFERSHRTRLANLLKATTPIPEKNLLRQRIENLKTAREAYMDMQRKALGIETDRGMEL